MSSAYAKTCFILLSVSVLMFSSLTGAAQDNAQLEHQLRSAPHFLEGMLDPEVDMSIVKIRGLYPKVSSKKVDCMVVVDEYLTRGVWPDTFLLGQNEMRLYASSAMHGRSRLTDYFKISLLVFQAKVNGKTNYRYGIPFFRVDTTTTHWASQLIPSEEVERAVRELWAYMVSGYSGVIEIENPSGRLLAQGSMENGKAKGDWKFFYYGAQRPEGILQERHLAFSATSKQLTLHKINGKLIYQHRKTIDGFRELSWWGEYGSSIVQKDGQQERRGFFRKDGKTFCTNSIEGYLNEGNNFVNHGDFKGFDRETGKLISYSKYRNGKEVTSARDYIIRGLNKPAQRREGYYCQGPYSTTIDFIFDTLKISKGEFLRAAIQTSTGDARLADSETVYVDTTYQYRTPHALAEYRIHGMDTTYLWYYDLDRGYGVRNGRDISLENSLERILYPRSSTWRYNWLPAAVRKIEGSHSPTHAQLATPGGVVIYRDSMFNKLKHGPTIRRYATGQLAVKGAYRYGHAAGQWAFYDWDGTALLHIDFDKTPMPEATKAVFDANVWQWVYPMP